MITAIAGLFLLVNRQTASLLENYLFWLMPMPVLVYAARYGFKDSLVPFFAINILSFIVALPTTTFIVVISGLTGLVYGSGVKLGKNNIWLLAMTFFFTAINYLITMVLFAALFGYDLNADVQQLVQMIESYGYQIENLDQIINSLVPMSLFIGTCMQTLIVHLVANIILKRLHIKVNPVRSLMEIKAPRWLGWALLAVMVLHAGSNLLTLPDIAQEILLVGNVFATLIFSIFGLIDIIIYSKLVNNKTLIILSIIIFFLYSSAFMVIGMLDIVTDYRSRVIERIRNVPK